MDYKRHPQVLILKQGGALPQLARRLAGAQATPARLAQVEAELKRLNPGLAEAAAGGRLYLPADLPAPEPELGATLDPAQAPLQEQMAGWAEAALAGLGQARQGLLRQARQDKELAEFVQQAGVRAQLEKQPELKARVAALPERAKQRAAQQKKRLDALEQLQGLVGQGLAPWAGR